jgi:large subunit ribosomal protein L13
MRVIDAEGRILGRMAVEIAQLARSGEEIAIINSERAVITGRKEAVFQRYLTRRQRGSPQHGPFFPRGPEGIVRRAIRGMVNFDSPEGKAAFSKVKAYVGTPDEFKAKKAEKLGKGIEDLKCEFVLVGELSKHLGYYYANEK